MKQTPWLWKLSILSLITMFILITIHIKVFETTAYSQILKRFPVKSDHIFKDEKKIEISKVNQRTTKMPDIVSNVATSVKSELLNAVTKLSKLKTEKPSTTVSTEKENSEIDETFVSETTAEKLKKMLNCLKKDFDSGVVQRGPFYGLKNYIRAEHGEIECHEGVTYTTHSDFTFLDNLVPVVERWNSPISIAIHAPGEDFPLAVDTIRYMRDCSAAAKQIKKWVTFHIFFHLDHIPSKIPNIDETLKKGFNCSLPEPYSVNASTLYAATKNILYPVNVGRNLAREAALTHFIFASDIELYPTYNLSTRFMNFIARDPKILRDRKGPYVFPLVLFEVRGDQEVPDNKTQLQAMLGNKTAIPFHKDVCAACHNVPKEQEWISSKDTGQLDVFTVGKRTSTFRSWEPIYIGTNKEPFYDERLSWQGKNDKMTQSYIMCVMDYEYMILNNAFMTHRPGIKVYQSDPKRDDAVSKTHYLLHGKITKELETIYGRREGCKI